MNDIIIPEITISHWELFAVFLTFFLLLVLILVVSNNWKRITSHLTKNNIFTWSAGCVAILFFVPALWQLAGIVWQPQASGFLDDDKRGYAILLAAVIGAPFVIWRTWVAQRQADTDEQGLITDRITKAVDQLGAEKTVRKHRTSLNDAKLYDDDLNGDPDYKKPIITETTEPNLEVRLGGIYALERIARDSDDDHITVMEILCAYIRNNSPDSSSKKFKKGTEPETDEWYNWKLSIGPLRFDIQAIVDVIARRTSGQIFKERLVNYRLDLRNSNLQRADFRAGNFERANFTNSDLDIAELRKAQLNRARLSTANINGSSIEEAELNGAVLYFASLTNANLFMAQLNGAVLSNADFNKANTMLAAVQSVSLFNISSLTKLQVSRMFGDGTTELLETMLEPPAHWPKEELTVAEFDKRWRTEIRLPQK